MSMTVATLIVGLIILSKGLVLLFSRRDGAEALGVGLLRNRVVDGILTAIASAWFLWIVWHLGKADFGDYRFALFALFALTAVGAWLRVRDFLGVRAGCVIYMLLSWHLLASAFARYEVPARLWMVSAVYAGLLAALYFGAAPFRARDLWIWFCRHRGAALVAGVSATIFGAWLLVIPAIFY
jgi:hypothetical protein